MRFVIGSYEIECHNYAVRSWLKPKLFVRENGYIKHFVWGSLSVCVENIDKTIIATCAECGSLDIGEVCAGDEGWTVCRDCRSVEQGYIYFTTREAQAKGII